jgi:hypothetical protein
MKMITAFLMVYTAAVVEKTTRVKNDNDLSSPTRQRPFNHRPPANDMIRA